MHWWFHQLQDDIISWNPTYKVSLDLPLQAPQLQKSSGAQELAGIARSPMLSKQQEVSTNKFCKVYVAYMIGYGADSKT